jgi:hypothetical protein
VTGWRVRSAYRLFASMAAGAVSAAMVVAAQPAQAATVPWGTVLVQGSSWAGAYASLGDLNVYSNGDGNEDQYGPYGLEYECFELAARWAQIAYGDPHNGWSARYAYQMYDTGPYQSPPFLQHPNGGAWAPAFGDLLVFNQTSFDPAGHVAVVTGVSGGYVNIVEQNWGDPDPTGYASVPIGGYLNGVWDPTYMPPRWGLPIRGWLHSTVSISTAVGSVGPGSPISLPPGSGPSSSAVPFLRPTPGTPRTGPAGSATPAPSSDPASGSVGVGTAWVNPGTPTPPPPADYSFGAQFLPTAGLVSGSGQSVHPPAPSPSPPAAGSASTPTGIRPGSSTLPPHNVPPPRLQ